MSRLQAATLAAISAAVGLLLLVAAIKTIDWIFGGDWRLWAVLVLGWVSVFVIVFLADYATEKPPR